MQKLQWTTVQKKVSDLVPQEINPRTISESQLSALKESIKRFNLVEIPAIDTDGTVLAGHQRLKVLKLLGRGDELIDVRIPNRALTKRESDQYLIGSNKLGGDWDIDLLKNFDPVDLSVAGFDEIELSALFDTEIGEEKVFNEAKELQKIKTPQTKPGDIIKLGNHRVLCGDATDAANLKRLFSSKRAAMVYSDPVYNISVDYDGGIGGKQSYGGEVKDTRSFAEYRTFLDDSLVAALAVTKKNAHIFYWCDQIYIGVLQELYRTHNIANKRVCIWLKNGANPVPTVAFNKVYEPCVYGVRGTPYLAAHSTDNTEVLNEELGSGNTLLEDITDVWTEKRLNAKDYEHATSKPLSLHYRALRRCTKRGDIVLDSFLGSGSTLLAAEQIGRTVYGCELEPIFCDLIIRRFEQQTGVKAKIIAYEKER